MADYSTLKAAVADVVKTNGSQAITGANLQSVLLSIINSIGGGGYIFAGVATPSTNVGSPDQNVFYIGGAGTYGNFGTAYTVPVGSIGVFCYNGSWTMATIPVAGYANTLTGYYTCSTGASTAAKSVSATGYSLLNGGAIKVKFNNANTAASPTLNINSTGAKSIEYNGSPANNANSWQAGEIVEFYYDDSYNGGAGGWIGRSCQVAGNATSKNKLLTSGAILNQEAVLLSHLFTRPAVKDHAYINKETGEYAYQASRSTKATQTFIAIPDGCDIMALGYVGSSQTSLALYSDADAATAVSIEQDDGYSHYTASQLSAMGAHYCRMTITDAQYASGEWFLVMLNMQEYFNSLIYGDKKIVWASVLKTPSFDKVTLDILYLIDRNGNRTVVYADGDSASHSPVTYTLNNNNLALVVSSDGEIVKRPSTNYIMKDDTVLLIMSTQNIMVGGALYAQWWHEFDVAVAGNDILADELIAGGGINKNTGHKYASDDLVRTDYIKIESGMNIAVKGVTGTYATALALYRTASISGFISAEQSASAVVKTYAELQEVGAKYFRCSFSVAQVEQGNWYLRFLTPRIVNAKIEQATYSVNGSDITVSRRIADSVGNPLTPTDIPVDEDGWEIPSTKEVVNVQKKAQQMLDIEWTPKKAIPQCNNTGSFPANVAVTGLPYSSTKEIDKYIGYDVSIHSFMTALNNPYSLLYTENINGSHSQSAWGRTYHGIDACASWMGVVCSVLSGYATGQDVQWSTGEDKWCAEKNLNMIKVFRQSSQGLRIGDIYWKIGHNRLVTGVKRDGNGDVTRVEMTQASGVKMNRYERTAENFDAIDMAEEGGIMYRNIELYKNQYTPSEFVAIDGETITPYVYNDDICTFAGDRAAYREGELIVLNYNLTDTPSHTWTTIEVYKDDALYGSYPLSSIDQTNIPVGQQYHALVFDDGLPYGKYKARMTDEVNHSDYTYWEVLETDVTFDSSDLQTISFSSSNGTPVSFTICDITGTIYAHNEFSLEDLENGYTTLDLVAFAKEQYPSRTFSSDLLLKVHFKGDYGMVTNEPISINVL